MSEEKIDRTIPEQMIYTVKDIKPYYAQQCLLCENTHEIPHPRFYEYPWVCSDCKEAIEFLKFLKTYDNDLIKVIMESKK